MTHVKQYREMLQQRADVIEEAVKEEFDQFENMENIEKLVEKRAIKQAKREKDEEHMYYTRGLMARKSGQALLKQKQSNEKVRKSQTISSINEVSSDWGSHDRSRAASEKRASDDDVSEDAVKAFDLKLDQICSLDELDFKLREDVEACIRCQSIAGPQRALSYKRDPGMYKAVLKERLKL